MIIVNFKIKNKKFEVCFIYESGYPLTKNERGSISLPLMVLIL